MVSVSEGAQQVLAEDGARARVRAERQTYRPRPGNELENRVDAYGRAVSAAKNSYEKPDGEKAKAAKVVGAHGLREDELQVMAARRAYSKAVEETIEDEVYYRRLVEEVEERNTQTGETRKWTEVRDLAGFVVLNETLAAHKGFKWKDGKVEWSGDYNWPEMNVSEFEERCVAAVLGLAENIYRQRHPQARQPQTRAEQISAQARVVREQTQREAQTYEQARADTQREREANRELKQAQREARSQRWRERGRKVKEKFRRAGGWVYDRTNVVVGAASIAASAVYATAELGAPSGYPYKLWFDAKEFLNISSAPREPVTDTFITGGLAVAGAGFLLYNYWDSIKAFFGYGQPATVQQVPAAPAQSISVPVARRAANGSVQQAQAAVPPQDTEEADLKRLLGV